MNRDRDEFPRDVLDDRQQDGAKRGQSTGPAEEVGDDDELAAEKEILVSLVDEAVQAQQGEKMAPESVGPGVQLQELSSTALGVALVSAPSIEQVFGDVDRVVRPLQQLEDEDEEELDQEVEVGVPIMSGVGVERITLPPIVDIRPEGTLGEEEAPEVSTIEMVEVDQVKEEVTTMVEPGQTASQLHGTEGQFFEVDEIDPVFRWGGGSPYGSDRPTFIVHIDTGEVPSLQLLQVLLRDTYTEIEGGQPGAETVEFVANEPRIPTVQRNIVTLDLIEGEWQPAIRNGEPVIEGQGINLISKLREVVATLYTGQLGYFVLNVPDDWEHPLRRKAFNRKLVEALAGREISEEDTDPETLVEKVRASPVVLAESTTTDTEPFFRKVWTYFSLTPGEDATSIEQVEEVQERVLKKNDWRRVTLTERQQAGDGASDEHYFWKAVIASGLARTMWQVNDAGIKDFDEFLTRHVLQDGVIETEKEEVEGIDGTPDIYVNATASWVRQGLNEFLDVGRDQKVVPPVVFEFETGRSEGAFNFRKLRETVEKYQESGEQVYIIVPTRILFRGRKRAEMINKLVQTWENTDNGVDLLTPVLSGGTCTELQPADDVITTIYGDAIDD